MHSTTVTRPGWDLSKLFGEPADLSTQVADTASQADPGPRDREECDAATEVAGGDLVKEIDACAASVNMTLFCPETRTWFVVKDVTTFKKQETIYGTTKPTTIIEIYHPSPGASRCWTVDADRPVIQRITSRGGQP
jgi:hypothetical protein